MLREVLVYKAQTSYERWREADNQRYMSKASWTYKTVGKENSPRIVPTKMLRATQKGILTKIHWVSATHQVLCKFFLNIIFI